MFEWLDTPAEIVDRPGAAVPECREWTISFENVKFRYTDDLPVLEDLSFRVEEGETVALVGATGAGQSTACHLLTRFYEPAAGVVRLGGLDVS